MNQATSSVKTYLGSSYSGFGNLSGTKALLNRPGKVTFTPDGQTMYFVDAGNNCLRKVNSAGSISTVALAQTGFLDNPPQLLRLPASLVDASGNVLVLYNGQVWIYATVSGTMSSCSGFSGSAKIPTTINASDLAISLASGTLYISDYLQLFAFGK